MDAIATLLLQHQGEPDQEFVLSKPTVTLGRATTNDIVLDDPKVSRAHARLEYAAGRWVVVDLGSGNGSWVNGRPVPYAPLSSADSLQIGDHRIRVLAPTGQPDSEVTVIDTEADLSSALANQRLTSSLANTAVPRLVIQTAARTWEVPLVGDAYSIGRGSSSDIVLPFPQVSRQHGVIERRGNTIVYRDLGSANGSWRGMHRIEGHQFTGGETIRIGPARLTFKAGFEEEDLTIFEAPRVEQRLTRPPVVFVPGFMGSELWRGSERIWPNVRHLLTNPESFRFPGSTPVEARGIAGEIVVVPNLLKLDCYDRVGNYLVDALGYERGKDLLEFGYDWRQDVRDSARDLARAIDAWGVSAPITLVAHSLGCLVSRWYVEELGGKGRVSRLFLMGGPHQGVPRMISGLSFGRKLLPFGILGGRMAEITATFPSIYQIQPVQTCGVDHDGQPIDLFADDRWLPEPFRPMLADARDFHRKLGNHSSVPAVSIFGYGQKTITGFQVRRDNEGKWLKLAFRVTPEGDNCIPQRSAVVEGTEVRANASKELATAGAERHGPSRP